MLARQTVVLIIILASCITVASYFTCSCRNGLACDIKWYGGNVVISCPNVSNLNWGPWSSCDVTCGGGHITRVRSTSSETDSQPCGQTCIQGSFVNNTCVCPAGYRGSCCEVAPVCHAPCQNGGTCVGDGMCRCPVGYYGLTCEIGSHEIPENMKPRLETILDPSETFKDQSWYEEPSESDFNRICYIKVATVNAPYDALLTAVSFRDLVNGSRIQYGNYSTGPVDANATLTGQMRFACLQVRCPGWTFNGTSFDVNVDIQLQSKSGQCNVTSNQDRISLTISTNQLSFSLVKEDNYGPLYGVYIATGYRQRAEYLSKHVCYSGHQYDLESLHPSVGLLATFNC